MKNLLIILLAITFNNDIAKINSLKKEAAEAFQNGNYEVAAQKYSYLADSMEVMDDQILMNLAHSYYQLQDSSNAISTYEKIVPTPDRKMKSIAYQQLGVMADRPDNLETALEYFKDALKADPTNEQARYNYEVVKKKLEKQKQQQQQNQDQQNQDQQNQDQEDQEQEQNQDQQEQNQDGESEEQEQDKQEQSEEGEQQEGEEQQQDQQQEGEEQEEGQQQESEQQEGEQKESEQQEGEEKEGEEQDQQGQEGEEQEMTDEEKLEALKKKLEEMNISPEKANNIFESYGNKEIQYLHQLRKKNTKKRDKNKPDW